MMETGIVKPLKTGRSRHVSRRAKAQGANSHDELRYRKRHKKRNSFARLKDWRQVATCYDRCPKVFLSAYALAAFGMFW